MRDASAITFHTLQLHTGAAVPSGSADTQTAAPAESRGPSVGADRPWQPRSHADAAGFKFVVHTQDGVRELRPEGDGQWTSVATTDAAMSQDPRPLAHLKMPIPSTDASGYPLIRLPGESEGDQQWFLMPNPSQLCAPASMPMRLHPIGADELDKPHLIGSFNFSDRGLRDTE